MEKEFKPVSISELMDKYYGKVGTPKRDLFDAKIERDIKREMNKGRDEGDILFSAGLAFLISALLTIAAFSCIILLTTNY